MTVPLGLPLNQIEDILRTVVLDGLSRAFHRQPDSIDVVCTPATQDTGNPTAHVTVPLDPEVAKFLYGWADLRIAYEDPRHEVAELLECGTACMLAELARGRLESKSDLGSSALRALAASKIRAIGREFGAHLPDWFISKSLTYL